MRLKPVLGPFELVFYSVGVIIGAGVYSVLGAAAASRSMANAMRIVTSIMYGRGNALRLATSVSYRSKLALVV